MKLGDTGRLNVQPQRAQLLDRLLPRPTGRAGRPRIEFGKPDPERDPQLLLGLLDRCFERRPIFDELSDAAFGEMSDDVDVGAPSVRVVAAIGRQRSEPRSCSWGEI